MKLLLDTHTFLWFINGDPELSSVARKNIEDPASDIFLSIASVWEMAIKVSIGKLSLPLPFGGFISAQLSANSFLLMGITVDHTSTVTSLPFHHRDPFDRLIIAQALVEKVAIIGRDGLFDAHGVTRYW